MIRRTTAAIAVALTGAALAAGAVIPAQAAPAAAPSVIGRVAANCPARPGTYVVSTTPGENLEGLTVDRGTMYVTSVVTGAIYTGSTRDRVLRPFSPAGADGRTHATGIHVDPYGRVVAAGAMTGTLWVYSPGGRLLQRLMAPGVSATTDETQFLNDFVYSRGYVYVTESWTGAVYRARVTAAGYGPLETVVSAADLPAGMQFLNGIAASPDGRYLLVGDWRANVTYRVDLRSRVVTTVQVTDRAGAPVQLGADGLLLDGHTARAVHTDWDGGWTAVRTVRFNGDFSRATWVGDSQHAGPETSPTTIAWDRGRLLWANSQLSADNPTPPFTVSEVPWAG